MKPSETQEIYATAARSRRIVPHEDEGRLWHKQLSMYSAKDVREALDAWFGDTTPGKDGEPRGKWLPTPVELKPVVERVIRERDARNAVKRYPVNWYCQTCRYRMSGFLSVGETSDRKCPSPISLSGYRCQQPMTVLLDERPSA